MFKGRIEQFLPTESSYALGFYRCAYFLWLTIYFAYGNVVNVLPKIDPLAARPGLFQYLPELLFSAEFIYGIYPIWIASLGFMAFGLLTDFSKWVACLLGYLILGSAFANGVISHQDIPHFLVLLVFAFSDCGQSFSIYYCSKEKIFHKRDTESRYAIALLRSIFVLLFFSSGIAKFINGGIHWYIYADSAPLFLRANIWYFGSQLRPFFSALNVWMTEHSWTGNISGNLVTYVELLSPLIFWNKIRRPFLIGLLLFQLAATFSLYIDFLHSTIILYLFWLPIKQAKEQSNGVTYVHNT